MLESPRRYDLLKTRLRGFTRTLLLVKNGELRATLRAWTAARRLRELLPILQLDGPTVQKLSPRLRRVVRRLGEVRQSDAVLALLDELDATERRGRQALSQVRDEVRHLAERARASLFRRKIGNDARRVSDKLESLLPALKGEADNRTRTRAMQWAARARVARRAANLKSAITAAGSVYLASRLQPVRTAARKLWYGAELASAVSGSVSPGDLRALARAQQRLEELDDIQTLIDRARLVQGSLATPDLKAWRDLDGVVISLENRCRALHAKYVRERTALVALCERLVARAPADGSAKRKVG
jgi:CHAD domain